VTNEVSLHAQCLHLSAKKLQKRSGITPYQMNIKLKEMWKSWNFTVCWISEKFTHWSMSCSHHENGVKQAQQH